MDSRASFPDERWALVASVVAGLTRRGPKGDSRRFIEAVIWVLRSGAPWRDLADRLATGRGSTAAIAGGLLRVAGKRSVEIVVRHVRRPDPDRQHDCEGASARRRCVEQDRGQAVEALGRSRGGFTTKLHALVTERGQLIRYLLTAREVNDITQAKPLVRHEGWQVGLWAIAPTTAMRSSSTSARSGCRP